MENQNKVDSITIKVEQNTVTGLIVRAAKHRQGDETTEDVLLQAFKKGLTAMDSRRIVDEAVAAVERGGELTEAEVEILWGIESDAKEALEEIQYVLKRAGEEIW